MTQNNHALEALHKLGDTSTLGDVERNELEVIISTALEAKAVPDGWQPIKTAPKTGEGILCWSQELIRKPYIAWWGTDPNDPEDNPDGPTWLTGDGDDWSTGYYYTPCRPTHWMPLPLPPEIKK